MTCDCAGHEGAGIVVAKGEDVGDDWKIGDRAGLKPVYGQRSPRRFRD
jgi:D-arabinose 1-dehydrogenase-like Zn-dependent alcohol dehydrogenase